MAYARDLKKDTGTLRVYIRAMEAYLDERRTFDSLNDAVAKGETKSDMSDDEKDARTAAQALRTVARKYNAALNGRNRNAANVTPAQARGIANMIAQATFDDVRIDGNRAKGNKEKRTSDMLKTGNALIDAATIRGAKATAAAFVALYEKIRDDAEHGAEVVDTANAPVVAAV